MTKYRKPQFKRAATTGKTTYGYSSMYYENRGTSIIVTMGNEEYFFKSVTEAKQKLGISHKRLKEIKRAVVDETIDDFNFEPTTGLYWRCIDES